MSQIHESGVHHVTTFFIENVRFLISGFVGHEKNTSICAFLHEKKKFLSWIWHFQTLMITLSLFILISRNVYENFLWMKVNWYLHYFFEIQSVKLTKWKLKLWNWKRLSSSNRLFRRKKQVWDFMIYLFYCKYYCTSSPRNFWRDDNSKIQTVLPDDFDNVSTLCEREFLIFPHCIMSS